jgi:hypothetical protein
MSHPDTGDPPYDRPVRIANCSGFFGDRLTAASQMVSGGPIDVLTGDWLAELTMLILARQRIKHGAGSGYARTFLEQMEQVLGTCLQGGIKVVANAGGLDPTGLAEQLASLADRLGLTVRIGVVGGDDLMPDLGRLREAGEEFINLDTGEALAGGSIAPITANAYLGGRGITAALQAGVDVVVTGRVTDAALVIGPAAWWHGWDYLDDLDALAGAVVAGHVIECGPQATGGNYPFFADVPGLLDEPSRAPGFPIAEVAVDGSSIITKHPFTEATPSGGMVTVGTVTAQLLYEIDGPGYANPDVIARFDTIRLSQVGADRVAITGVRGEPAPTRLKVAMNYLGGFRNSMTVVLTGRDADRKADAACRAICGVTLERALVASPGDLAQHSTLDVDELHVEFIDSAAADPQSPARAQSFLRLTVKAADPARVGKAFTSRVVEMTLSGYPGAFPTTPPPEAVPYGVYWPTTIEASKVAVGMHVVSSGGAAHE